MVVTSESKNFLVEDIRRTDFSMIKLKLQDEEEGQGWSCEKCDETEIEYKKFLALKRAYPEKEIVPNRAVELFWHQHLLDTAKYAEDCENLFGYFIHHFPYFGMNGKEDAQNLVDAFDETKQLYSLHFNINYTGKSTRCKTHKCRTQCKPMKCK